MAGAYAVGVALRRRDADMDRLKEHLAERVQREERRQQRDKEVYERLKRAHAALRADRTGSSRSPSGSSRSPSGSAGAVAAATRELRPVEIVGIYEAQRDAMEQELEVSGDRVAVARGMVEGRQAGMSGMPRGCCRGAASATVRPDT